MNLYGPDNGPVPELDHNNIRNIEYNCTQNKDSQARLDKFLIKLSAFLNSIDQVFLKMIPLKSLWTTLVSESYNLMNDVKCNKQWR